MALFGGLLKRFEKQCETSDNHKDEALQTRYYKGNLNQLFSSVEEIFHSDKQAKVVNSAKEHGELAIEVNRGRKIFMIITIITVKPYQTAVDVNASTETGSLTGVYGHLKEEILRFYQKLDQKSTYIGSGKNL